MKTCLGCGAALPDAFLNLGKTPLANSYVKPENASLPEPAYRLAVAYCPSCHLVQLTDLVPPEDLFSEYLYFSSYSQSYVEHAREMAASLIRQFELGPSKRVLEVASNDGYLLQFFQAAGVQVRGVEPAANIARHAIERGIPTDNRFFNASYAEDIRHDYGAPDLVIGNNVLAHVPQINEFLSAVRSCLAPAGVAVFEFPHLLELMRACEFDTIYHEHVFYYSLSAIRKLADRAGLEVFHVEPQKVHGGSLRVFLAAAGTRPVTPSVESVLAREENSGMTGADVYRRFSHKVAGLKGKLVAFLHKRKAEGARIAAYGAPAKGNTLLNYCGIGSDIIEFTVDRSPYKQNLLLPGSRIPIREPEALLREKPDYTVILPWNLAAEIVNQQQEYLERGGKFVTPVPQPKVINVGQLSPVTKLGASSGQSMQA
jgi:SAM-dependent methyltransferase